MNAGYESWFLSARDPASRRALWIRHTRHGPRTGRPTAALWCTVVDGDADERPATVKQVFGNFPAGTVAEPGEFVGSAEMGDLAARWDLAVTGSPSPLRPLRPALLYRAPLPRTKLEANVPDGQVSGVLEIGPPETRAPEPGAPEISPRESRASESRASESGAAESGAPQNGGRRIDVSGWRATVGHNWGAEHADSWVWLHAAGFATAPDGWLELVLARIRIGPARSPWTAMGALSLGGEPIPLGGLGRRPTVDAHPGRLTASIPSPRARIELSVTAPADTAVAVPYADPSGGTRAVSHAALAAIDMTMRRRGDRELTLSSTCVAYEYGDSQGLPGIVPQPLPAG
jgi:hypothetical protein